MLRGPKPDDGDPPDGAGAVPAAGAGDGVRAVKAPQLQHARLRPPLQPRRTRRGHVLQLPAPERLRRTEVHRALHRRPTCWCLISLMTMIAGRDTEYNLALLHAHFAVRTCVVHACMGRVTASPSTSDKTSRRRRHSYKKNIYKRIK